MSRLTDADMRLVQLIADGLTNAQIGDRLGITADQAKGQIDNALRHGNARNRANLVAVAYRQGRLSAGEAFTTRALRDTANDLLRKADAHQRRGFGHIKVGVFDRLRVVMADANPVDLDLLTPEPGSLAARLDAIEPVELDCDEAAS